MVGRNIRGELLGGRGRRGHLGGLARVDERVALLGHVDEVGDGLLLVAVVGRHDKGDVVDLV